MRAKNWYEEWFAEKEKYGNPGQVNKICPDCGRELVYTGGMKMGAHGPYVYCCNCEDANKRQWWVYTDDLGNAERP